MQLGIFSRTYPPTGVDTIFARIAQDGFQAIQFNFSSAGLPSLPADWPEAAIDEVKTSAARRGLRDADRYAHRPLPSQITVPSGTTAFFGITTMPSRT